VTHVLLTVSCLLRRADAVEVIGAALRMKATGAGHRPIATRLARPASTVRGWLRAFMCNAEMVRSVFTALLVQLDPLSGPLPSHPSVFADAVEAVGRTGKENRVGVRATRTVRRSTAQPRKVTCSAPRALCNRGLVAETSTTCEAAAANPCDPARDEGARRRRPRPGWRGEMPSAAHTRPRVPTGPARCQPKTVRSPISGPRAR
jgi:hypothetical protein